MEIHTDVVENAVEQHPQSTPMRLGDEVVEITLVAEARIDAEMVGGVVTMGTRVENRAQGNPGCAQLDGVIKPANEAP
ncbi:hypothetical protein NJB1604_38730 [Mycobacterium marinum]|nr:hypothetical protein NJB1604_38730 [Mycobacterium marinum]